MFVAVQDRKDLGVSLGLAADQVGDCVANRAVELADDHLRLGRRPRGLGLDKGLTRTQDDPLVAFSVLVFPFLFGHGVCVDG
jgi:hypothetical protein